MAWCSPPSRREVSLILFSLTTFVLFYNLESSFTNDGLTSEPDSSVEDQDWDALIYGNWTWEEFRVAENARKQALNDTPIEISFPPQIFGTVGVNEGILDWGDDIPTTTVLKHVPGALRIALSCGVCSEGMQGIPSWTTCSC